MLGVTVLVILVAFVRERARVHLAKSYPVRFALSPFALTNQLGHITSTTNLLGKVWVADIIFTSCAGPCPRMTSLMSELHTAIPPSEPVRFVTLTTDPEHDTPAVLERYGKQHRADPARWFFLTGSKPQLRHAAVSSLKFTAEEKEPDKRESENDLFVHSTIFIVVDKRGNVRGIFETDQTGAKDEILTAVRALAAE